MGFPSHRGKLVPMVNRAQGPALGQLGQLGLRACSGTRAIGLLGLLGYWANLQLGQTWSSGQWIRSPCHSCRGPRDVKLGQQDGGGAWVARWQRNQGRLGPTCRFRGGFPRDPVLLPLAPPPSCCPGSAAISLPRPDIFSFITKY